MMTKIFFTTMQVCLKNPSLCLVGLSLFFITTTRVWCISGKDTTVVSWKGADPDAKVPPAIREFYGYLQRAIESAKKP